jgi:hypothetical protein
VRHSDDLGTRRDFLPNVNFPLRPFVFLCVLPPPPNSPTPASSSRRGVGDCSSDATRQAPAAVSEAGHARSPFLRCLALLAYVCLLAQCTPTEHRALPPQVQENTQAQTLTPEEQLDLFNTFLDRA